MVGIDGDLWRVCQESPNHTPSSSGSPRSFHSGINDRGLTCLQKKKKSTCNHDSFVKNANKRKESMPQLMTRQPWSSSSLTSASNFGITLSADFVCTTLKSVMIISLKINYMDKRLFDFNHLPGSPRNSGPGTLDTITCMQKKKFKKLTSTCNHDAFKKMKSTCNHDSLVKNAKKRAASVLQFTTCQPSFTSSLTASSNLWKSFSDNRI